MSTCEPLAVIFGLPFILFLTWSAELLLPLHSKFATINHIFRVQSFDLQAAILVTLKQALRKYCSALFSRCAHPQAAQPLQDQQCPPKRQHGDSFGSDPLSPGAPLVVEPTIALSSSNSALQPFLRLPTPEPVNFT